MFDLLAQLISIAVAAISASLPFALYKYKQIDSVSVTPLYFDQYDPCSHLKIRLSSEKSVFIKSLSIEKKWIRISPNQENEFVLKVGRTVSKTTPIEIDLFVYPRLTGAKELLLRLRTDYSIFSRFVLTPQSFFQGEQWSQPISSQPQTSWTAFERQIELLEQLNKH